MNASKQASEVTTRPAAKRTQSSQTFGSAFKRVGKYIAESTQQPHSHSALHLCPPSAAQRQRQVGWQSPQRSLHLNEELDHESLVASLTALNRTAYLQPFQHQQHRLGLSSQHSSSAQSFTSMTSDSSTGAAGPGIFQNMIRHQYSSDNVLQTYDTLTPDRGTLESSETGLWVVYIHGGYFRDPKVDSTSIKPAIEFLETGVVTKDSTPSNSRPNSRLPSRRASISGDSDTHAPRGSSLKSKIIGYASINYRLSPHTAYPQDPSHTPKYFLNNAHHADHLNDVISALTHFQRDHPEVGNNYILAGHSVGATLALLALVRLHEQTLSCPKAVIGLSGIYDFELIHRTNPDYKHITGNAMKESEFAEASPSQQPINEYEQKWKTSQKNFLIAHSKDDGLVSWTQVESVQKLFDGSKEIKTDLIELHGKHNDIWAEGKELARAIEKAIEMCSAL